MKKYVTLAILLMIVGVAGMAAQKFAFGDDLPSYSKKWTFQEGGLKQLVVNSEHYIETEFIQSNDGSNYVEISGNMQQDSIDKIKQVSLNGNKLELDLSQKFQFQFFSLNFQSTRQHMTIALSNPADLASIQYNLESSGGDFKGLQADKVNISSTSGNIDLGSIKTRDLKVSVESGNINAETIQADVEMSAQSGNIKVEHLEGNGRIKIESGNIQIAEQNSTQLDLSAESGNITVNANPDFKGFYDAKADSGDVNVPDSPRTSKDLIKARTESGNITIGE